MLSTRFQKPNHLPHLDNDQCQKLGVMLVAAIPALIVEVASPTYPIGKVGEVATSSAEVMYNFALECPNFVFPKVGNT